MHKTIYIKNPELWAKILVVADAEGISASEFLHRAAQVYLVELKKFREGQADRTDSGYPIEVFGPMPATHVLPTIKVTNSPTTIEIERTIPSSDEPFETEGRDRDLSNPEGSPESNSADPEHLEIFK